MSIGKGWIIGLILGIVLVLALTPWDLSFLKDRREVSVKEVANQLKNAKDIYIVEILGKNNQKIMQCGVDVAYSMGAYNKTVHPYVINQSQCYTENGVFPTWLCAKTLFLSDGFVFYIKEGIPVNTYEKMITIDPLKAKNCQVILQV